MPRKIRKDLKPRDEADPSDGVGAGYEDTRPPPPAPKPVPPATPSDDDESYFADDGPASAYDDTEEEVAGEPAPPAKPPRPAKPPVAPAAPVVPPRRQVVLGEPRDLKKLTKKARESLKDWRGKNHGRAVSALVKGHIEAARKKFGHQGVFHGNQTKDLVIGIPVPAFAFEFLIANDVFPLGLIIQLVAKHGTGKSGLLAEFARWFDLAGGFNVVNENETKFSPDWYESIMGTEAFDRMTLNRCQKLEDWQEHITFDLGSFKRLLEGTKENPGPGRTIPGLFGVDSIMGKMSEDSEKSILRDGSASRGFPVEALKITRYLRTVPQWLDGWPFAIVLVNHLKVNKDQDTGQDVRSTAGGVMTNFQESFELEMKKVGPKVIECADWTGFEVQISCEKNSFGPTHRAIRTRILWWEEPDPAHPGQFKQKTVFDWDWSTVNLLYQILEVSEKNVRLRQALKAEGFDMDFASPTAANPTAWSKFLGVKKDDGMTWSEMGALIRQKPDVLDTLRRALRIRRRAILAGDYYDQMKVMAEDLP